jgi:hypothetical protein
VSLDKIKLTSHRLGLTGKPDLLLKAEDSIIGKNMEICAAGLAPSTNGCVFPARRGSAMDVPTAWLHRPRGWHVVSDRARTKDLARQALGAGVSTNPIDSDEANPKRLQVDDP